MCAKFCFGFVCSEFGQGGIDNVDNCGPPMDPPTAQIDKKNVYLLMYTQGPRTYGHNSTEFPQSRGEEEPFHCSQSFFKQTLSKSLVWNFRMAMVWVKWT